MRLPTKHEHVMARPPFLPEDEPFNPQPIAYWAIDDDDVMEVHCMDCGTRIGTVNAGDGGAAVRLTDKHNQILHQE